MYAVIRRYQFDPKSSEEISRRIREGFIPLLRKTPGFVAYHWLDTGDGVGASMAENFKIDVALIVQLRFSDVGQWLFTVKRSPESESDGRSVSSLG